MNGFFDEYMVENGGFLTHEDLAYESAEVILDNKYAHLSFAFNQLMMEHDENLLLIENKVLMENGTYEDYETLIYTEAEETKKKSKGLLGGLLDLIASIFKTIRNILFGEAKDNIGDKEQNVNFKYDPNKLMEDYDKTEDALKKHVKGNKNPLKMIFGTVGGTLAGISLYIKVGKPFINKLGSYVDQKAKDLVTLENDINNANLTGEDAKLAKKGIDRLKDRASKMLECMKAIPKALKHDPEFEDTVQRAKDAEEEEKNRPEKEAEEAKAAKDKEKAEKKAEKDKEKADKKADKDEKNVEKKVDRQSNIDARNEGIDPANKGIMDKIKNDTRGDDEIKKEIEDINSLLPKLKARLKKLNPLAGYADPNTDKRQQASDTARGVIGNLASKALSKIPGTKAKNRYTARNLKIVDQRDKISKSISKLESMLKFDNAVVKYRNHKANALELDELREEIKNNSFNVNDANIGDIANLLKEPIPMAENALDEDFFTSDEDISESLIREYGYNPLDEDFDTLIESAFSLD